MHARRQNKRHRPKDRSARASSEHSRKATTPAVGLARTGRVVPAAAAFAPILHPTACQLVVNHLAHAAQRACQRYARDDDDDPYDADAPFKEIGMLCRLGLACSATYDAVHRARVLVDAVCLVGRWNKKAPTKPQRLEAVLCVVTPAVAGDVPTEVEFQGLRSPWLQNYAMLRGRICARPINTIETHSDTLSVNGDNSDDATEGIPFGRWDVAAFAIFAVDTHFKFDMRHYTGNSDDPASAEIDVSGTESAWHLYLYGPPFGEVAIVNATVRCGDGPKSQCRRLL
ncbi:hypothetical protein pdul_cds_148 [Pandoravirus dulcis]|uniref:Uncharacterized protein n=1 Tax=Pandoravirus dulcis TaxID=1349409 RepID=S4VP62_9VIRU|nr:hypothetical protein pdul_cds_148 [Pandoravirus dulcis]AGO82068.1 hypothetical protein pdul_cds_148 [Pandoravirus dulcis]